VTIELIAPAKLNLALEITGKRPDGYHDLVSVMQTVDFADRVRINEARTIELSMAGDEVRGVPREGPANLAFAAAQALAATAGDANLGVHIELEKRIPAGMGLGGGSTDAAAVLRGLNRLWRLDFTDEQLCEVGASVGSDVPFFVIGGTALVTGRGEHVEALPDALEMPLTLFLPDIDLEGNKTARMYATIRPDDYTDGHRAHVLAESIRRGLPLSASDLVNAFDAHVREAIEPVGRAMAICRDAGLAVTICGSGPGFFSTMPIEQLPELLAHELEREWAVRAVRCRTLGRAESLAAREV
jgi:4-diphosphocytidyl-2-C-methyl-D-erythritol kinase